MMIFFLLLVCTIKRHHKFRLWDSTEDLAPDVDLDAIANMTDGYSGSDLKVSLVLCSASVCL